MAHKTRPFTRRQRAKQRRAAKLRAREEKAQTQWLYQDLSIFRKCDPERTERLANGD